MCWRGWQNCGNIVNADSRRYKMLSVKFIEKYGVDTSQYDVIKGWRADASYFYIAREFVRDNIDFVF